MNKIDASIEGYRYAGIRLTEQQFEDLNDLGTLITANEHRQKIPVFNIMLVLKILGLLPPEMVNEESTGNSDDGADKDFKEQLYRKFGRPTDENFDFPSGRENRMQKNQSRIMLVISVIVYMIGVAAGILFFAPKIFPL